MARADIVKRWGDLKASLGHMGTPVLKRASSGQIIETWNNAGDRA